MYTFILKLKRASFMKKPVNITILFRIHTALYLLNESQNICVIIDLY